MKRIIVFFLLIINGYINVLGQDMDSLSRLAITYASQNNIEALQKIYDTTKNQMPHHFQLYCDLLIARNEGKCQRALECVDSLYKWYPKQTKRKLRMSLAEIKADILRQLGRYEEMYDHCLKEIKYFKRYGFTNNAIKELYLLQSKAELLRGHNYCNRLMQVADRRLVFELDSLYYNDSSDLDEMTRLRCEFLLSQAFHKTTEMVEKSQILIADYGERLYAEELTFYIKCYANELIRRGEWKTLKEWAIKIKETAHDHSAPLDNYIKWADAFKTYPLQSVECPSTPSTIQTTHEWPILLKANINHRKNTELGISLDQPYTFISEEVAEHQHIKVVKDTLTISTSYGLIEVCPAIIDELAVQNVVFHNIFAYIILKTNKNASNFNGAIGLNQWLAFDKLTFFPEEIRVEKVGDNSLNGCLPGERKNMCLTPRGGLRILTRNDSLTHPLDINFSFPNNFLYQNYWTPNGDSNDIPIYLGDVRGCINAPIFVDYQSAYSHGVLGVPFLRHYKSMSFDFQKMALTLGEETPYTPLRHRFNHSSDKHYLARNYSALTAGNLIDEDEKLFLQLILSIGKNVLGQVAEYCQNLRRNRSDFYDLGTEVEALFLSGEYQDCKALIHNKSLYLKDTQEEITETRQELEKYLLYTSEDKPSIHTHHSRTVKYDLNQETHPVIRIHKRKAPVHFDIFYPYTEIAAKQIKKFKVKRLGTVDGIEYGLIPKITCGSIELLNIPCRILSDKQTILQQVPDEGKGIHLGWNALRLLHQVTFTEGQLILSTDEIQSLQNGADMYHTDHWYIEAKEGNEYHTYTLSPKETYGISEELHFSGIKFSPSDIISKKTVPDDARFGNINFKELQSKAKSITFDFRKMKLISK